MKNVPVSPLRQRMMEDMKLRNLAPSTQYIYLKAVEKFSVHFSCSPDKLDFEDARQYQLDMVSRGLQATTINAAMAGLRFFYKVTMRLDRVSDHIPYMRKSDKLPVVLSKSEVEQFLQAIPSLKYRTAFSTIYATGLRVSEAAHLKVSDIDSKRMVIHVQDGKGRKDRYVMLPQQLLDMLRTYWKRERPKEWLFPNRLGQRLTGRSLQRFCRKAAKNAGLSKHVTVHTLRHCFATHLLEQGVDIRIIQDLMGHRSIMSTTHYVRVATNIIRKTKSPLEGLELMPPV